MTKLTLILVRSDAGDGGWSLYPPGTSDEEIREGKVPPLRTGTSEFDEETHRWSEPSDTTRAITQSYYEAGFSGDELVSRKRATGESDLVFGRVVGPDDLAQDQEELFSSLQHAEACISVKWEDTVGADWVNATDVMKHYVATPKSKIFL